MRNLNRLLIAAAAVMWMLGAAGAKAAPVTYLFTSGTVTLSAFVNGSAVMAPAQFVLDGQQVTVDEAALSLDSFTFTFSNASLSLSTPYAGYSAINLDWVSLSASAGVLTLIAPVGDPQEYGYSIGPVSVSGQLDATGSSPAISDMPFAFTNPTASGSLYVASGPGGGTLTLDGLTVGALYLPGASHPLVLKADLTFEGAVVPEPGTFALVASGLGILATTLRRRIS